jgi:hypothetical protein
MFMFLILIPLQLTSLCVTVFDLNIYTTVSKHVIPKLFILDTWSHEICISILRYFMLFLSENQLILANVWTFVGFIISVDTSRSVLFYPVGICNSVSSRIRFSLFVLKTLICYKYLSSSSATRDPKSTIISFIQTILNNTGNNSSKKYC